ncbi:MAG: GHKL domain-containing protein, partial [Kamptonema sp. SIO4C4]|nr:GHKL domain-containing protein [Kamptonema sp. SIO4C4]
KEYGTLPFVSCSPVQLNQVFLNLLSNAIDALKSQTHNNQKEIRLQTRAIADNTVEITIEDNGPGIHPEILDKIFDPFFTTKPVGQGTGLGLATSHEIIKNHQGKITVSSWVGEGTTLTITLPVKLLNSPTPLPAHHDPSHSPIQSLLR